MIINSGKGTIQDYYFGKHDEDDEHEHRERA